MGLKLNPRAPESMQMLNPRGHHTYKKSESRIFKGFKIVLHNLNQIENMHSGPFFDRKMNPRVPESMQISNPHGHHIYKKSEECILKILKLCFTHLMLIKTRKRLRDKIPYGPEIESKSIGKYANLESAWAS
jgi:hypothetical protein